MAVIGRLTGWQKLVAAASALLIMDGVYIGFQPAYLLGICWALIILLPDRIIKDFSPGRFGGRFLNADDARRSLLVVLFVASIMCAIAAHTVGAFGFFQSK